MALDVLSAERALELAERLACGCGGFKVGLELFTASGPEVVRRLAEGGHRVFLDLKFHDIPNTVAGAARAAVGLGAFMFNVHAAGGSEMMRRAAEAAGEEAARLGRRRPLVVAVTVLTSLDAAVLAGELGWPSSPEDLVVRLALLAREAGLDGVVCSPREVAAIKAACGRDFLAVTPGIRPAGVAAADQRRPATPAAAFRAGADYLVLGRAVTGVPDPAAALAVVTAELAAATRAAGDQGVGA